LNSELYLLFGYDKAFGSTYSHVVHIVRITDEIDLEYPAFVNRPFLSFYNGKFEYDEVNKLLKFSGEEFENIREALASKEKYGRFTDDSLSSSQLYEILAGDSYR